MRLQRLQKGENSEGIIRTNAVVGELQYPVRIGASLVMLAQSLDPSKDFRMVTTSPITKIERIRDGVFLLTTETGSLYQLDEF